MTSVRQLKNLVGVADRPLEVSRYGAKRGEGNAEERATTRGKQYPTERTDQPLNTIQTSPRPVGAVESSRNKRNAD